MNTDTVGCDWCGEPFIDEEQPVPGYKGQPTHERCRKNALQAQILDKAHQSWWYRGETGDFDFWEREPFQDWPNGQGTYE